MAAIFDRNKAMVRLLLGYGASPKLKWTPFGPAKISHVTPLRAAIRLQQPEIARLLRNAGATE